MLFLLVFSVQAIAITLVVLVLRHLLEKMLIDSAVRSFEYFAKNAEKPSCRSLTVISARPLRPQYQERIRKVSPYLLRPEVTPVFQVQSSLWGGLIIKADDKIWDSSLRLRLQQALAQR